MRIFTWNANFLFSPVFVTGGSCKKSPHNISWIPPNGLSLFFITLQATKFECYRTNNKTFNNDDTLAYVVVLVINIMVYAVIELSYRATISNLSKSSPSTIEISSMIKCLHRLHCCAIWGLEASSMHCSTGALPEPMPANACNVVPPIWQAATPVLAVANVNCGAKAPA